MLRHAEMCSSSPARYFHHPEKKIISQYNNVTTSHSFFPFKSLNICIKCLNEMMMMCRWWCKCQCICVCVCAYHWGAGGGFCVRTNKLLGEEEDEALCIFIYWWRARDRRFHPKISEPEPLNYDVLHNEQYVLVCMCVNVREFHF